MDETREEEERGLGPVLTVLVVLLSVGGPLLLYVGTHAFLNSATFLVRDVMVEGQVEHSRDEILRVTGLDRPRNILTCRSAEMERALRELDWIREASVQRQRGNRLHITVRETGWRSTLAIGEPWLIGDDGHPIRRWTGTDGMARPFILGRAGARTDLQEEGRPPGYATDAILGVHQLVDAWEEQFEEEGMNIMEVEILSAGRYRLALDGGMEILLSDDDLQARLDRLALLLEERPGGDVRVERILLDGASMDRVAVRVAGNEE